MSATFPMLCILTVLLTASAAPGRTAFVGENSHPGFAVHDAGRWRVIADVNPDLNWSIDFRRGHLYTEYGT